MIGVRALEQVVKRDGLEIAVEFFQGGERHVDPRSCRITHKLTRGGRW
jgi:hypothetical protein